MSDQPVCISLVLRKRARTSDGVERVERLARELGLEPSHHGRPTVSLRASPRRFHELFGERVEHVGALRPTGTDLGATGGQLVPRPLTVPGALSEDVEAVSVEPPAQHLATPPRDPADD